MCYTKKHLCRSETCGHDYVVESDFCYHRQDEVQLYGCPFGFELRQKQCGDPEWAKSALISPIEEEHRSDAHGAGIWLDVVTGTVQSKICHGVRHSRLY